MLFCVNNSTIQLASLPNFFDKSKYIDIACHLTPDHISADFLILIHIYKNILACKLPNQATLIKYYQVGYLYSNSRGYWQLTDPYVVAYTVKDC